MRLRDLTRHATAIRLLVVALAIANVLLLTENHRLKAGPAVADGPEPGADLARFLEGARGGGRHVLFYLAPDCGYCDLQTPQWVRLVELARDRAEYRIVYFEDDIGLIPEYLDATGLADLDRFPATAAELALAGLRLTPTTVLVSSDGRAERAWVGAWDRATAAEVADALGLGHVERDALLAATPVLPKQPPERRPIP